jgi:hypothetical protein
MRAFSLHLPTPGGASPVALNSVHALFASLAPAPDHCAPTDRTHGVRAAGARVAVGRSALGFSAVFKGAGCTHSAAGGPLRDAHPRPNAGRTTRPGSRGGCAAAQGSTPCQHQAPGPTSDNPTGAAANHGPGGCNGRGPPHRSGDVKHCHPTRGCDCGQRARVQHAYAAATSNTGHAVTAVPCCCCCPTPSRCNRPGRCRGLPRTDPPAV